MSMPLLELISQLQRLATGAGLNAEALPAETHFHGLPRLISQLGIRFRSFGGNTRSTLFLEEKKKKKNDMITFLWKAKSNYVLNIILEVAGVLTCSEISVVLHRQLLCKKFIIMGEKVQEWLAVLILFEYSLFIFRFRIYELYWQ